MLRAALAASALLGILVAGCTTITPDPLQVDRGIVTVDNRTAEDWTNVEIWLNRYFRVTAPLVAAGSRLQVPLDTFVSGYGQRFDARRMTVDGLRLVARSRAGAPVALERQVRKSGLAGLGGKR